MRTMLGFVDITSDKSPNSCLWNETAWKRIRPCGRILMHQAPTVPFTIGLKAINGCSAVPSVLFKFGPVIPGPG